MNYGYNYTPVTSVSTTLLLLQIFLSLSMSYLYVLESKMCSDKGERQGVYNGLGTATVTRMMRGAMNLMVMEMTIIMTT